MNANEPRTESAETPARWRPLAAAGMSLIVPGAGQWWVGLRRRAMPFFVLTLVLVVSGALLAARGAFSLLEIFVQPQWVWTMVIGNIALFVVRLWSAADAFVVAGGLDLGRVGPLIGVSAFFLCFLLILPHLFVGSKAASWLEVLGIFAADEAPQKRAHHPPIEIEPEATPDFEVPHDWQWGTVVGEPDGRTRMEEPTVSAEAHLGPIDDQRITVLLAGGDSGPGRSGLRTDVMIIASIDLSTNKAVLISVSRELVNFPIPPALVPNSAIQSYQSGWWDQAVRAEENGTSLATVEIPEEYDPTIWLSRINELHPIAVRADAAVYRDEVDPGLAALRDSFEIAFGIRIDYYAMVTMGGFVDFIDALGGVRVTNRETVDLEFSPAKPGEEWIQLTLEPGQVFLTGREALGYVRNRTDTSDLFRTRRQRCFIRELAGQIDPGAVVRRFEAISRAVTNSTITDIPLRILPSLVAAVGGVDRANIGSLSVDFSNATEGHNYRNLGVLDFDMARARVANAMRGITEAQAALNQEC